MITKGTEEYKRAGQIANKLQSVAGYQRRDSASFQCFFDPFYNVIDAIEKTDTFAAKIANTINSNCDPYGYQIARVSSKQAWILACCIVENNINIEKI